MTIRNLGMLLGASALSLSLVACGSDEKPDDKFPLDRSDSSVDQADAAPELDAGGVNDASVGSDAAQTDASMDGAAADAQMDTADASGDAASADASGDGAAPDASARLKPKCVKNDYQVVVIGDSYINWLSHKFPEQLKTATKQDWRMLAVGGTAMGSGGIGRIPDQFDDALFIDPDIHTVLMDGGGNDILVPDLFLDGSGACKDTGSSKNPNCQKIVKLALDAADVLMNKAAAAGVRDVVYFFYPHIPENRLIGGPHPNEILDYALPMVKSFCDGAEARTSGKLRCHFVDMIPVYEGHTPGVGGVVAGSDADYFNEDIHPNAKGSQAMVDKIWQVMTERCIGQKGKDCCEK